MHFHVITIFPEIFQSFLSTALIGKAVQTERIKVDFIDPRDFTHDPHRSVDDTPFGGGGGMVLKPEPVLDALDSISDRSVHRVLLTPQGEPLSQSILNDLSRKKNVAIVCGRYEGFDERIRDEVDQQISLGDFVLNGGEVAAMSLIDGVSRLIPGVLGNEESIKTESHTEGLLEYPHYTRPEIFNGQKVPNVLLSGNHKQIAHWRLKQALGRTYLRRPNLLKKYALTPIEQDLLDEFINEQK